MRHALLGLLATVATACLCGGQSAPAVCSERRVELVGDPALERSSCMVYNGATRSYGVLRPGAQGRLVYYCDQAYGALYLEAPGAVSDRAEWSMSGDLGTEVNLSSTDYTYGSDCGWEGTHRVTGSPDSGSLAYTYEERVTVGGTDCLPGCIANATLRVLDSVPE